MHDLQAVIRIEDAGELAAVGGGPGHKQKLLGSRFADRWLELGDVPIRWTREPVMPRPGRAVPTRSPWMQSALAPCRRLGSRRRAS